MNPKVRKNTLTALCFLIPNFIGVCLFVVFPVIFSIIIAFTNWDIRDHNMWQDNPLKFVGLDNFIRLFTEPDFLRFLGNTFFLMIGLPFGIGAALLAAILLSKESLVGSKRTHVITAISIFFIFSIIILVLIGMSSSAWFILLTGILGMILVLGMSGGKAVYRTLFYTPHFTAGVATYILWKKLYRPYDGPINRFLTPPLDFLASTVNNLPAAVVRSGYYIGLGLMLYILFLYCRKIKKMWLDGEAGTATITPATIFILIPVITALFWNHTQKLAYVILGIAVLIIVYQAYSAVTNKRIYRCPPTNSMGSVLVLGVASMALEFALLGLSVVLLKLPEMAANGLTPPMWLQEYHWAKPAIMTMAFWAAMGSNSMLIYLAALTNVPQELYDAANVDGAGRLAKFWHITWPQLAPATFFIIIMRVIGGLQGGFEMARTMTNGGPAGSTTTLSYFIYTEGFETGRLGYASAVAWTMFILVFTITIFNWKFGSKYVNE